MKRNPNKFNDNNEEIRNYQKRSFISRLPFGLKATFIKYWFYGALYFFCFMGLGLYVKDENLVLVTGLIGGVLFDIALYNIFLLFADTREEASKWWIYKSKKFYSIFINVIIITGLIFAFYYIVVPINKAKPKSLVWLFQEPLSAAVLLTILDTVLVWLKNLTIMLVKKLFFPTEEEVKAKNEAYIKIVELTPVSVSIELNNQDIYEANKPYSVLLNNEFILKKIKNNSLTIYDLKPDTQYKLAINRQNIVFTTPKIYKFYKVDEGTDLQKVIDMADQYSLIVVNKGTYKIKSLTFKNNLVIYLRKDALLLASTNEEDYPIIPPFNNKKDEVYGNYLGEAMKMRQSIIHIDHLKNVKIVGEGIIDAQVKLGSNKQNRLKIAPPNLIFINHSSNISIVGITLKNSPQSYVHPFFSYNINLINLNITNEKSSTNTDGINPECSSDVRVIGTRFINLDNCVAIKSGKKAIADFSHVPSRNVFITNCVMENSRNAIALGEESSSGIHSIEVSRCSFINLESGINVMTKRGNGQNAIIKDVNVRNIKMNNVLTPIVMNMFSGVDASNSPRLASKKRIPIDEDTPYLDNFLFKNIEAKDFEYAAGYFYGLPEKYIYEIKIEDSIFTAKDICKEGLPIITDDDSKCSKKGFIAKNVRSINLKNVKLEKIVGKRVVINDVSEIIDNFS